MYEKLDIIAIGECLVELSSNAKMADAECLYKYYGGDSLAVAIAALRAGSKVGFISRVGNDSFKDFLFNSWEKEGLDISNVKISDEQNGLYIIARPTINEKEAVFYRKKTAAAKLSLNDIDTNCLQSAKCIYTSGITQSLSPSTNEAVEYAFKIAKQSNIITAYDPNFHPTLINENDAKENFSRILPYVDILFMSTKHDTKTILDVDSPENSIKKLWDMGVQTVILKSNEQKGYYSGYNGNISFTKFYTDDYIDTTCSGDAFNGGFLHAVTNGFNYAEAVKFASIVAGLQAQNIGAIKSIPYKDKVYSIFRGKND